MRQIKFRAWEKKSAVMRLWDYLRGIDYTKQFALFDDPDFVWMQFTGLLDKNGKEIYEGDIVRKFNSTKPKNDIRDSKPRAIHWTPTNCGFNLRNPNPKNPPITYEIIGNIYENPELISPTK